ncbi:MAG: type 4 pilin, partial [Microcystis panniformis]
MLEVMIAILTIAAFLTGTLQLMAFTALYKVRAERQAQANFWIQEDFEDVKYLASTLDVNSTPPNQYITTDVCTNINQGYATALRRQLTTT